MNKFNLFLIMSIGAVFVTASIFGLTVTSALAQGNGTGEVEAGPPLVFTAENATIPANNMTNSTTPVGDSVVGGPPQVDAPQGQETSGSGDETSGSGDETSGSGDETSGSGDEGSEGGDEGSEGGDEGSEGGDEGSEGGESN